MEHLLIYFDSLRSVTEIIDWSFYKYNNTKIVVAYWIDYMDLLSEEKQLKDIYRGMVKAKKRGWVLNLHGHNIGKKNTYLFTSYEKLEKIVSYANELKLRFIKMEDIFSFR